MTEHVDYRVEHDAVTMQWSAATHTGNRRRVNEDSVFASFPVFVVADGMGGHAAGDVASSVAVEAFRTLKGRSLASFEAVEACVESAFEAVDAEDDPGAGTTLAGAVIVDIDGVPHWFILNVGDSRTYVQQGNQLKQVSVDHSVVQELFDSGVVDAEGARRHPERSVITRALGAGQPHRPDFWLLPVERGQRLLVCTDGLTSEIDDDRIRGIVAATASPADAAASLVAAALDAGGNDNISVVVADVETVHAAEHPWSDTVQLLELDTVPRRP